MMSGSFHRSRVNGELNKSITSLTNGLLVTRLLTLQPPGTEIMTEPTFKIDLRVNIESCLWKELKLFNLKLNRSINGISSYLFLELDFLNHLFKAVSFHKRR